MKFENSTIIFFCILNISLQTLILEKKNVQKRKLKKDDNKKVVYQIKQDPLTREMNIEKIFDSRDEEPNQIDNSPDNFEYDQNEDGKFIFRSNPHLKLQVGDLKKVPEIMENIREQVQKEIFLEIKTGPEKTKFHRSSQFYKRLPIIKQNYFMFKNQIEDNISQVRNIVDFVDDYIYNNSSSALTGIFTEADIELDQYNKEVVRQLLEKLIPKIEQLWDLIFNDLHESFVEIEKTYENKYESAQQRAEILIRNSIRLTILEKEITEDYFNDIKFLSQQIKNNKHYHHIADTFDQTLDFSASQANDPFSEQNQGVIEKIENSFLGSKFNNIKQIVLIMFILL